MVDDWGVEEKNFWRWKLIRKEIKCERGILSEEIMDQLVWL